MKKSIVALAVAAAVSVSAVAQAETVFYGSLRVSMDYGYNHYKHDNLGNAEIKRGWDMISGSSRVGFKGGEDLGNGLSAIYVAEFGFDGVEGGSYGDSLKNRLAYVGLTSESMGTFVAGRLENPFDDVIADHGIDFFNEAGLFGSKMAQTYLSKQGGLGITSTSLVRADAASVLSESGAPSRLGNALAYVSPNWNGFQFTAAGVVDQARSTDLDDPSNDSIDLWTITARYAHESGAYVGAGYLADSRMKIWAVNAGFEADNFVVGFNYLDGDNDPIAREADIVYSGTTATRTYFNKPSANGWDIGGKYIFNDGMSSVMARYGQFEGKQGSKIIGVAPWTETKHSVDTWAVGFEHKLTERTRTWIEYEKSDSEAKVAGVKYSEFDDTDRLNFGIRHDF